MKNLLELSKERTVLLDGAMGTMLYNKGVFINKCYEEVNLSSPKLVEDIQSAYVKAGSEVLFTNTFGANRYKLSKYGLGDKLRDIILAGINIAKKSSDEKTIIAGSIGPVTNKKGELNQKETKKYFKEVLEIFFNNNIIHIVFETFADIDEILTGINTAKELNSDSIVIALMPVTSNMTNIYDEDIKQLIQKLDSSEADFIGFNCYDGPDTMLKAVRLVKDFIKKPLAVKPNEGSPRVHEGRNFYMTTPEYFAEYVKRFIQNGVKLIGGCCGTTPKHIKFAHNAIKAIFPAVVTTSDYIKKEKQLVNPKITVIEKSKKSKMAEKLYAGEFISSIEITPPRDPDYSKTLEKARIAKQNNIDVINIPDGPRASARISPMITAKIILDQAGIEPVLHYACRDRNLIGMQSDLLGAAAAGINNVLIITGDPPKIGDYPDATAVFDVDSIGLTQIVSNLNKGMDAGNNFLNKPTQFLKGVGVNPGAIDINEELRRLKLKIQAGAEFIITQPVFDTNIFINFYKLYEKFETKIPVIAGIWPLVSYRNAEFMNSEVPGASVPVDILERMKKYDKGELAVKEGIKIAIESFEKIKQYVQGIQVSAPFGKVELAVEVISSC